MTRHITRIFVGSLCAAVGLALMPAVAMAAASPAAGPVAQFSPTSVHFPDTFAEDDSAPKVLTLTNTGTAPLIITGAVQFFQSDPDIEASFRITATTCNDATLDPDEQCTVTVVAHPEEIGNSSGWLYFDDNTSQGYEQVWLDVVSIDPTTGLYYPVAPHRVLDTRTGVGAPQHPVAGDSPVHVQVAGQGGLPPTGVAAVVLNLTVTHGSSGGHVSAYPTGSARPDVSSINFARGWTGANLITVPVGSNGQIDLFSSAVSVDLVADVEGWYAASKTVDAAYGTGAGYESRYEPSRLLDTRHLNGHHQPLAAHQELQVAIGTDSSYPNKAAAITLTAVKPQATGYLSVGPAGQDLTKTSTLNLRTGVTTPNLAIVQTSPCEQASCGGAGGGKVIFRVYNGSSHAVDVLVDIQGTYAVGIAYRFRPMTPTRIVDTRKHLGTTPLGPAATRTVELAATPTDYLIGELVTNVTAVAPTANTVITVWRTDPDVTRPGVSTLNPARGATVASGALIGVSDTHVLGSKQFDIYNSSGTTNILVDVSGRFDFFLPDQPFI